MDTAEAHGELWKAGAAHSWYGGRDKTTVIEENKSYRNAEHQTMKRGVLK